MKKILLILVFGFFLSSCETTVGYHEHYNNCMLLSSGSTISEVSKCGKEKRLSYLNETKSKGSQEGDTYMLWVDLLAKRVEDGEISESQGKMILLEKQQIIASKQRDRELQALQNTINSMPKTYNCSSTGYGSTVYTNCTGY